MLKLGIIGSGFGLYGLFPAFRSIAGCKVLALCGQEKPHLKEHWGKIGSENLYTDWREMLDKEELDAVAIAVTPEAQYDIAKAALEKGLHVFAEKPLALTLTQAHELLALAEKQHVTHGMDFIFPEIAEWQKAKELLEECVIGSLRHLSVDWEFLSYDIKNGVSSWKTDVAKGGGALSYYFSHGLHYLEHFAGRITDIEAQGSYDKESRNGAETAVDMTLTFESGSTGRARVCCNSREPARHRLEFQGEKGVMILESEERVVNDWNLTIDGKEVPVAKDAIKQDEDERVKIVRKLAARFVSACAKGEQMTPSFREGVRVQELIEVIRGKMS